MKVQVTTEHLDRAIAAISAPLARQCGNCLIAQALKDEFDAKVVSCAWLNATIDDKEFNLSGASKLIKKFDDREYNELRMELPAYIDVERV